MKLGRVLLSVSTVVVGLCATLVVGSPVAMAAVTCPDGTVQAGQSKPTYAECNVDSKATANDLLNTVKNVINVVLGILGVVAVVVIILGGFTFMTSQGDAGKVMKGRNTILWGVIGLVVALLAFAIVNFVLDNVVGTGGGNGNNIQPSGSNEGPGNNIQPSGGNNIQPSGGNNIQPR